MAIIVNPTAAEFKQMLAEKKTFLADFYATWCGPCKMLSGVLENVEDSIGMPILKIDVDKHEELARRFRVMSIPTVILFEDGPQPCSINFNLIRQKSSTSKVGNEGGSGEFT